MRGEDKRGEWGMNERADQSALVYWGGSSTLKRLGGFLSGLKFKEYYFVLIWQVGFLREG